jgi:DNA-3-methyladenine glycosylase
VLHEGGARVGRIVETEAYRGPADLACHARFGVTRRTRSLFLGPGHAYVYFIYGMHECFNVTCLREGAGHAVLVRGVELVSGAGTEGLRGDGPGRLTRALGIDRRHDGVDVTGEDPLSPVTLHARAAGAAGRPKIGTSARVGVGYAGEIADAPWRFFDRESPHVSRPSAKVIGRGKPATT